MRALRALGVAAIAAGIAVAAPAAAADPRPELGAGPHRDRSPQLGGDGERPRQGAPEPKLPQPAQKEDASQGGSSAQPGGSDDERKAREEDERKATEAKEKMKKKPGYKDEAPSPRAGTASPGAY
jgi:hypothetical protein